MVDEGSKKLIDSVVKEDDILELNVTSTSRDHVDLAAEN